MRPTIFRLVSLLAAHLLALPLALQSQKSQTAAKPNPTPSQQPAPTGLTLHAHSDLVVIDVVVNDAKQHPIRNLKASDFTLFEDKVPQQIKSFEEHRAPLPSELAKLPPMPTLPPGTFTNYSPAPPSGAVNILLLDTLNTPMNAQAAVRQQLQDYLKNAPASTRIAIFGLNTRLTILQGFTSDPAILKDAIAKAESEASNLLDDPLTGTDNNETMSGIMSRTVGSDPIGSQMVANVQDFEASHASFQLQLRAQYTLAAMNQLARYLVSIPGRKNLIWFSGSFPLTILPDGDLADPFAYVANMEQEYRETTNALARSQVAVYPIDARGIVNSSIHSASSPQKNYLHNPKNYAKDQANFYNELFAEHDTMSQMAEDTGGRAFMDTDGLTQAVAQAIDSGSNYYTISYSPSSAKWNGKYRKIEVKLTQPGIKLYYRHGYFADDPNAPPKRGVETSAATAPTPGSPMNMALMRGAPDPTEILLKVRIRPASASTEATPATGNQLNPAPKTSSEKAAVKGPFRRYLLDFLADPGAVTFTTAPNGNYECAVEFVTYLYDRDGSLINTAGATARASLTRAEYVATIRTGVPFHQEISVPATGEFYLRSAVHDLGSDRVGAVEVPVASVARFTPQTPSVLPSPPHVPPAAP